MATTRKGGFNNATKPADEAAVLGYLNISLKTTNGEKRIGKFGLALREDDAVSKAIATKLKSGEWSLADIESRLILAFTEPSEKLDADSIELG